MLRSGIYTIAYINNLGFWILDTGYENPAHIFIEHRASIIEYHSDKN